MNTIEFDYDLPKCLIAQTPIEPRDQSRLMVVSRQDESIQHRHFFDLPEYLKFGDLLVFNESRVFPAKLKGHLVNTGGTVELLLLHSESPGIWNSLVRPGRRMRVGAIFEVGSETGHKITGEVVQVEPNGSRLVKLSDERHLFELGSVPLPPYIRKPLDNPDRYQTVYARDLGSVAAPTAGLHFTQKLLDKIRGAGVELAFVILHVGWGSFRPVKVNEILDHRLYSERWEMNERSARSVNNAHRDGRRVISIGTTTVRLLEHAATVTSSENPDSDQQDMIVSPGSGWADLFIYPGYKFRVIDGMVTNFHLPRSTLLMLTSAFTGRNKLLKAYAEAVTNRYRFYSFGDAMLIV